MRKARLRHAVLEPKCRSDGFERIRKSFLYSLKAGDLNVCKVNLVKPSGGLKRC